MLSILLLPAKLVWIPPLHSSVHDNILLLIIDVNKRNLKISGNSIGCEMFLWVKRTG